MNYPDPVETRACAVCGRNLAEGAYSRRQWSRPDSRRCKDCLAPEYALDAQRQAAAAERWKECSEREERQTREDSARILRIALPAGSVADGLVTDIVNGSDAAATKALHRALDAVGPMGKVAHHLLAAQKSSSRAKAFRSYSDRYYETKGAQLGQLADALRQTHVVWGWGEDSRGSLPWVLYVDLPTGQVSFHARDRGDGPDYPGSWDRIPGASGPRIIAWAHSLIPTWTYALPVADSWTLRERKHALRAEREALITGNTYPVREQLRELGGRWDPRRKGWWVPRHHEQKAQQIVNSRSDEQSGE